MEGVMQPQRWRTVAVLVRENISSYLVDEVIRHIISSNCEDGTGNTEEALQLILFSDRMVLSQNSEIH